MTTHNRTRPAASARDRSESVYPSAERRRAYSPPRVRALGELRDVTMGPSPGLGETGSPSLFRA